MYVYALSTTIAVTPDGDKVRVHEGEVWAADDPLVKASPKLFGKTPSKVRRTAPEKEQPVEQATAAPGEKRRTRAH